MNSPSSDIHLGLLTLAALAAAVFALCMVVIQISRRPSATRRAGLMATAACLLTIGALAGALAM
jgi:hypothetical protein